MYPLRRSVVLLSLAPFAACNDQPTGPVPAEPVRSVLLSDGRYDVVDVRRYAHMAAGGDWTQAIQIAVDSAHAVYFPAAGAPYTLGSAPQNALVNCRRADPTDCSLVRASVRLPSGTRVYGDGAGSVIRQTVPDVGVFMAGHTSGGSASGITVESLRMEHQSEAAPLGVTGARFFALWVRRGSNIAFRNNQVSDMGMFENDTYLEWEDSYLSVPDGGYPGGIEVSGNVGVGRRSQVGYSQSQAILIGYANGATITNNTVRNFLHGIQWYGGNSGTHGAMSNPRKASNITVSGNNVSWVESGIWGGMSRNILVESNTVQECADVCLDSEGDINARYQFNTARNAHGGVLSVFSHAKDIVFYYNDVFQDDQPRKDQYGNAKQVTNGIFTTSSYYPNTTITVANNTFTYTGPPSSGIGVVTKAGATAFYFNANTLNNVGMRMLENHGGAVQIRGNRFSFDRGGWDGGTQRPAIYVGNHYGDHGEIQPINGNWSLEIYGNYIHGTPGQDVGILAAEDNPYVGTQIDHWIFGNQIRNFNTSIAVRRVQKTNGGYDYFLIENNGTTGSIPGAGNNIVLRENYTLEPEPSRVAYSVRGPSYNDWQGEHFNNENAGTVGESRDLEAFRARVTDGTGQICYQAFVEGYGWTAAACDNNAAGTIGEGRPLRAVRVWLNGAPYGTRVCYTPHVGNVGWMSEVCNGVIAGMAVSGTNKGIQALRIRVVN